jgi:hypothetical protein
VVKYAEDSLCDLHFPDVSRRMVEVFAFTLPPSSAGG